MLAAAPVRCERIDLRTLPESKELIVRVAAAGMSVSAFLLGAAQQRAKTNGHEKGEFFGAVPFYGLHRP
ncbi:MAG: hypothetical protein H6R17_635 [Proteobacteria bacterium]|nr:hypothetical protein [Pseudomonadota bacterium]